MFPQLLLSLLFSHSHHLCSHRVFSLTLTHSVLSECSHSHSHTNSSHSHMLSLILSHRVFSLILSHYLFSHTNSLILSQSVPTPTLLTLTVIPDTFSQSVLSLHSLTHPHANWLVAAKSSYRRGFSLSYRCKSTKNYTLVAPLDPPYHPNQFNQEDGINLKDSLDKASSYPHSTHFILSRLQKIAKTIPFHSIPYKSFSFTQKESSILT